MGGMRVQAKFCHSGSPELNGLQMIGVCFSHGSEASDLSPQGGWAILWFHLWAPGHGFSASRKWGEGKWRASSFLLRTDFWKLYNFQPHPIRT